MTVATDGQPPASFQIDIELGEPGSSFHLALEAVAASASGAHGLHESVQAFVAAAQFGLFSLDPSARTPAIQGFKSIRSDPFKVSCEWHATGLQPGAFKVLLRLLEFADRHGGALTSLTMRSSSQAPGTRLGAAEVARLPFPAVVKWPGFPCTLKSDADPSAEALIRLDLHDAVPDAFLQQLMPAFNAWDKLVVRGGYVDDIRDMVLRGNLDEALAGQQTYLSAPSTIEHVFYQPIGSTGACHAIVNLSQWIDRHLMRVASLEVE